MVVINGVRYEGNNVTVNGDKIIIDGNVVNPEDAKEYHIEVHSDNATVHSDSGKITVHGNADKVNTMSGSVDVGGSVNGNVSTMSGTVRSGSITGNVSTMSGSIYK